MISENIFVYHILLKKILSSSENFIRKCMSCTCLCSKRSPNFYNKSLEVK